MMMMEPDPTEVIPTTTPPSAPMRIVGMIRILTSGRSVDNGGALPSRRRARRRGAWDAEVAGAQAEAAWFARDLLPQLLQARTPDALAGGWRVSAARVAALEDQLTALEATAPDQGRRALARDLRDAVRHTRAGVDTSVAVGQIPSVSLVEAAARLQAVLNAAESTN